MINTLYTIEKLYEAHLKVRKNKRHKNEIIYFELHLSERLHHLQRNLGKSSKIQYYHFTIHEPKRREVYATNYATRVSLRVLCDEILKPVISKRLIYDNAACQEGKGTHFAQQRLTYFLTRFYRKYGQNGYALKCDIRKYFDEIDHEILMKKLRKIIQNPDIIEQLEEILASYHTEGSVDKGLPLGNQTSQWFALYYLDNVDRWIKEKQQISYYVRYMDDFVLLSSDKNQLQRLLKQLTLLLREEGLSLNHKTQIYPLSKGFEFLGFRFVLKADGKVIRRLRTQSKKRMKRRLNQAKNENETVYRQVQKSYLAHLKHGTCKKLMEQIMRGRERVKDYANQVKTILEIIVLSKSCQPKEVIVLALFGSRSKRVLSARMNELKTYGAFLSEMMSQQDSIDVIEWLIREGYVHENKLNHSKFLTVSYSGTLLMLGETDKRCEIQLDRKKSDYEKSPLMIRLDNLRKQLSHEYHISSFLIFDNKCLKQLEQVQPQTQSEFLSINGLGEKKWEQFGEQVLEVIRECL